MTAIVLPVCFVMLAVAAVLAVCRLFSGPTLLDRILAYDMVAICAVGLIILLSVSWETGIFIEILLIFSLLGFVGAVAFVCYIHGNPERLRHWMREDAIKGGRNDP